MEQKTENPVGHRTSQLIRFAVSGVIAMRRLIRRGDTTTMAALLGIRRAVFKWPDGHATVGFGTSGTSLIFAAAILFATCGNAEEVFLGQGTMSGEVTATSVLVQTRLTKEIELDETGDLSGTEGFVRFERSPSDSFEIVQRSRVYEASSENDYIVRHRFDGLKPCTRYFYRASYGKRRNELKPGQTCSFSTLPGANSNESVLFIVGSCMNYIKFMHGKEGNAGGPLTATEEDKQLGFPAFATMQQFEPDFFVGTGDIVYYDNKFRLSTTVPELRKCWHEQFRFPRMIDFFREVPTYWSKDDHDFRYNDSDNSSGRLPLSKTGIDLFHEQLPIAGMEDGTRSMYRTHRVNRDLQIWLTEGREFRSPNRMPDGPGKSLWGKEQRDWLQATLKSSDAKWKLLISPTPMVGPDMAKKQDNHASLNGFRHEANEFFEWIAENRIENFMTICGDRHWQYHSVHPSGVEEFACGALNDENSRLGILPGDPKGTDPSALISQPYISPEPSGGFLVIKAGEELQFQFVNDDGKTLYRVNR